MNSKINLLRSKKELQKENLLFTTKHEDSSSGGLDTLICTGTKNWQVEIKNFMGHYGHFWESAIFDFGKYVGFVQWYEHTRGGHTDVSISIIDDAGNLLGTHDQFAGNFSLAVSNQEKVWFLHRDDRVFKDQIMPNFSGSVIVKIDLQYGMVEEHIPVIVPDDFFVHQKLSHGWLTQIGLNGIEVSFCECENEVCLNIGIASYQRDKDKQYQSFVQKFSDYLN